MKGGHNMMYKNKEVLKNFILESYKNGIEIRKITLNPEDYNKAATDHLIELNSRSFDIMFPQGLVQIYKCKTSVELLKEILDNPLLGFQDMENLADNFRTSYFEAYKKQLISEGSK